jgi:hypothetical protein
VASLVSQIIKGLGDIDNDLLLSLKKMPMPSFFHHILGLLFARMIFYMFIMNPYLPFAEEPMVFKAPDDSERMVSVQSEIIAFR